MTSDILIVEDHPAMRRELQSFLARAFPAAQVRTAADATAAMDACTRSAPDVVLMDIVLPDGDGIALTGRLLAQWPAARVIMVSNHVGSAFVERARAAGAIAFVAKERIADELVALVVRALQQPRARGTT